MDFGEVDLMLLIERLLPKLSVAREFRFLSSLESKVSLSRDESSKEIDFRKCGPILSNKGMAGQVMEID